MKNIKFKIHSKTHQDAIEARLKELGHKIDDDPPHFLSETYEYICLDNYGYYYFSDTNSCPVRCLCKLQSATLDDLYDSNFIDGDNANNKIKAKIKELQNLL